MSVLKIKDFIQSSKIVRSIILLMVLMIYLLVVLSIYNDIKDENQGTFTYALDDPYIHMAIAKNFALHRVWGVTRFEFTSSTSSPLWTFLLAVIYQFFGVNDITPLIMNVISGVVVIFFAFLILNQHNNNNILMFLVLTSLIFFTPLPTVTFTGMEHVLHILITLWFVHFSAKVLSGEKHFLPLIIFSFFVVTVRYEGLFVLFAVCLLLFIQKRFFLSVSVLFSALLPVTVYGFWSISNGWFFLPNSILLKGQSLFKAPSFLGYALLYYLWDTPVLMIIFVFAVASVIFLYKNNLFTGYKKYFSVIFLLMLMLHLQFARTGWFFRYEAYLVFFGVIVVYMLFSSMAVIIRQKDFNIKEIPVYCHILAFFVVGLILFPFFERVKYSLFEITQAARNIYEQQYQMGRFLQRYYNEQTIVANDIGAIAYLADIRIIDLWGLGSLETGTILMSRNLSSEEILQLGQKYNAVIAIIYDRYFDVPQEWLLCGRWRIFDNVVAADHTVSLYAIHSTSREDLILNLIQFRSILPETVKQYEHWDVLIDDQSFDRIK